MHRSCLLGKVWDLRLEPGQSSPLHTHVLPYTFVVLNGSTVKVHSHSLAFEQVVCRVLPTCDIEAHNSHRAHARSGSAHGSHSPTPCTQVTGADGGHLATFTATEGEALSFDIDGDHLVDTSGRCVGTVIWVGCSALAFTYGSSRAWVWFESG